MQIDLLSSDSFSGYQLKTVLTEAVRVYVCVCDDDAFESDAVPCCVYALS